MTDLIEDALRHAFAEALQRDGLSEAQAQRAVETFYSTCEQRGVQAPWHYNPGDKAVIKRLRDQVGTLKDQITQKDHALMERNRDLDALHYVWCSGGCNGGVHRFEPMRHQLLTEEVVQRAERNTRRLRTWIDSREFRAKYKRLCAWVDETQGENFGVPRDWFDHPNDCLDGNTPWTTIFSDHDMDRVMRIAGLESSTSIA